MCKFVLYICPKIQLIKVLFNTNIMRTRNNQFTEKINSLKKGYVWNTKRRFNNLKQ